MSQCQLLQTQNLTNMSNDKTFRAKSYIESINPYKQGKSKADTKEEIVKLSSNENALKTSKKAIDAYKKHSQELFRYADGSCAGLKAILNQKYGIEPSKIVFGAGSDELIALLIQAFVGENDEVIYSEHGFLMYAISAQKFGAKTVVAKETNLTTNVDNILAAITTKTKMIFIANPNNPTGSHINKAQILKLIENTPKNVLIILDLAYAEFVDLDENKYPDVINLVNKYDNVVMLRTFSKIYGLASLRLGWSYSCEYIAEVLNKVRGPFNVSGSAMAAGEAALLDDAFIKKSVRHNKKWLKIIKKELGQINIKTHPSTANFILIDFGNEQKCQEINQYLLKKGIILREMHAYKLPTCLRMTVGTEKENLKVIELLKQFQN